MTRTYVTVVALFFGIVVLFSPDARACVSCNYTPEVANTGVGPKAKKRATAKKQQSRPAKKRVVKKKPPAKAPKAVETVATGAEPGTAEVSSDAEAQHRSGTAAFAEREAARAEAAAGDAQAEVGCRRFSPQAGTTVEVPCE